MWREGQNQWHLGYRQKTECNKGCTAAGLLSPSSVDMAMNLSLPRALVYAQVGDVLTSVYKINLKKGCE